MEGEVDAAERHHRQPFAAVGQGLFVEMIPSVRDVRQAVDLPVEQQFAEMAVDYLHAGHSTAAVPEADGSDVCFDANYDLPEVGAPGRDDVPVVGVYGADLGDFHLIDRAAEGRDG